VVADAQKNWTIKWKNPKRIHPLSGTFGITLKTNRIGIYFFKLSKQKQRNESTFYIVDVLQKKNTQAINWLFS
jgi:hypothetical protein